MTVKLPIVLKPHITSECWTCYRFAIMQTSEFYTDWLMSHMELVTFSNGRCIFGYDENIYPLSYFNEILDISDGELLNVPPERIVDYLKEQLNKDKYIIIDLNQNRLYNNEISELYTHDTLIYGYDDEKKEFFSLMIPMRDENEGRISFESIEKAYEDVYCYYKGNLPYYHTRRSFHFGLTLISVKPIYKNSNMKYDFYKKLHKTLGKDIYKKSNGVTKEFECEYTIGVYRYRYIIEMLNALLKGERDEVESYKAILKVYEYHTICYAALESIVDDNDELIERYANHIKKLHFFVQMFLKYRITRNNDSIKKIISNLKNIEDDEADLVLACRRAVQGKFIES